MLGLSVGMVNSEYLTPDMNWFLTKIRDSSDNTNVNTDSTFTKYLVFAVSSVSRPILTKSGRGHRQ